MRQLEPIEKKLKDNGYKLTNQRKTLIEVFLENKSTLLSAEEIYTKVNQKFPGTNFSTIYRNLDIFILCEIIHRININGSSSTYELNEEAPHHHHLMICKDCGRTEALDFCPMEDIVKKLKKENFVLTDHKFELYGYCKKCTGKTTDK